MYLLVASEIKTHKLSSLFRFVFLVIELVEFARAVWYIVFEFVRVFQYIHRKEFLSEVSPVQLDPEDRLV